MKTIEVSDEQYEFLVEIAKRLKEQDNRITANPIFCVYQKVIVNKASGCGDETGWADDEGNILSEDALEEEINQWRKDCPEDKDLSNEEILNSRLEYRQIEYSIEDVPVNGQYYFTEKGAQNHIDANHYHYREPFVYVESAWRNFEWQIVREILLNLESSSILRVDVSDKGV